MVASASQTGRKGWSPGELGVFCGGEPAPTQTDSLLACFLGPDMSDGSAVHGGQSRRNKSDIDGFE